MFAPKKAQKSELLEVFRRKADASMLLLIESLWRDLQALYAESKLAETDINKADSEHPEYDPRYKFVRDIIGSTASYAQSLGFNNTLNGEFSKSIGFGNVLNAMFEIVLGSYSEAAEGNPDEWIPTDRLLTIANGEDSENRSNALEVFKSGLFKLFNAVVLGKYKHGEGEDAVEPLPGTLQFDEVLQIFRTAWEQILSVDLETVALNTIPKIVEVEGVRTIQWVAAPEGGASSYLTLSDTPAAYPSHGNLPRGAADGVPWSENVGDDGEVWVRSQHNSTDGPNILVGGSATLVAGKTYKITVTITGRTLGSVAVQVNAATIATLTATGTVAHVAATSSAHAIAAVPSPDFDGTVTSIAVQLVTVTSRKGLRFVNDLREVLSELLFFNGNSVINSALPADFFGTGNTYLDATVTDAAEKDKMRLAGILYDKNLKILSLPTSGEFRADKMGVGLINPITFDRTIDSRVRIYAASTQIANLNTTGHVELYANPRIKTSGTAPSEVFTEVYLNPLYDTSIQAAALGQVATITAGVGGLKTVTWAAISGLLPSASNGDILYYNGGWQKLAKGADGQVLTLAASLPSWADASSGGSCLWTQTANGARIDQPAGVFGQAPAGARLYVGTWTGVAPSVFFQALTNAAHDMFVIETFNGLRTRFIYNGNVVFPANIDCAKFSLGGKNIFTTQKTLTISATGNFNYMSCSSTDYVLNLTGSPSTAMLRIDNQGSARPIDYFNSSNQNRFWVDETGAVFADSMYCRRTGYTSFGVNIIGEANFAKVTSRQIYISAGYLLGIDVGGAYRTIINSDGSVTPWAGVSGTFTSSEGKTITVAKGMIISIA